MNKTVNSFQAFVLVFCMFSVFSIKNYDFSNCINSVEFCVFIFKLLKQPVKLVQVPNTLALNGMAKRKVSEFFSPLVRPNPASSAAEFSGTVTPVGLSTIQTLPGNDDNSKARITESFVRISTTWGWESALTSQFSLIFYSQTPNLIQFKFYLIQFQFSSILIHFSFSKRSFF